MELASIPRELPQFGRHDNPVPSGLVTGTGIPAPVVSGAPVVASAQNSTLAKELVRYRFKTGATASTANFVTFRALLPSWQNNL